MIFPCLSKELYSTPQTKGLLIVHRNRSLLKYEYLETFFTRSEASYKRGDVTDDRASRWTLSGGSRVSLPLSMCASRAGEADPRYSRSSYCRTPEPFFWPGIEWDYGSGRYVIDVPRRTMTAWTNTAAARPCESAFASRKTVHFLSQNSCENSGERHCVGASHAAGIRCRIHRRYVPQRNLNLSIYCIGPRKTSLAISLAALYQQ